MRASSRELDGRLYERVVDGFQRVLVECRDEVLRHIAAFIRLDEVVVEAHLCLKRRLLSHPVDRALDLSAGCLAARLGVEVRRAAELDDMTCLVLDDFLALDDVGVLEAYLPPGLRRKYFLGGSSMKSSCSM